MINPIAAILSRKNRSDPGDSTQFQDAPKRALLIGHSHVFALRLAMSKDPGIGDWLDICPLHGDMLKPEVREVDGNDQLHPGILSRMSSCEYNSIFLTIGGGPHIQLGIVPQDEPFDFVVPGDEGCAIIPESRIIPYDAILAILRARNEMNFRIISAIRKCFSGPIYHLDYPPPLREDHIRANPGPFAQKISENGVTPFSVRRKLWSTNVTMIQEMCEKIDIKNLPVPENMIGSDGSMARLGLFRDPIHGGLQYGRAVAQQISKNMGDIS